MEMRRALAVKFKIAMCTLGKKLNSSQGEEMNDILLNCSEPIVFICTNSYVSVYCCHDISFSLSEWKFMPGIKCI